MTLKLLSILPPVARLLKRYRRALVEINDEFCYESRAELEAYLDDDNKWSNRTVALNWSTWEESQGIDGHMKAKAMERLHTFQSNLPQLFSKTPPPKP